MRYFSYIDEFLDEYDLKKLNEDDILNVNKFVTMKKR